MADKQIQTFEQTSDYVSRYANNSQYEIHTNDIKVTFGEIQVSNATRQHTAITMTWVQAKLMLYFLQANISIIEEVIGKVIVPIDLVPNQPQAPTPEQAESDPRSQVIFERMTKLHDEFVRNNSKQ